MHHSIRILLAAFAVTLATYSWSVETETTANQTTDQSTLIIPPIEENQGYLLLKLNVGDNAPTLVFARHLGGSSYGSEAEIELRPNIGEYQIIPLKKGRYQIREVKMPLFDLPYYVDYSKDKRWNFTIEKQAINFAGYLEVGEKRGKDFIYANLAKREATYFKEIHEFFSSISNLYPLRSSVSTPDIFLKELAK